MIIENEWYVLNLFGYVHVVAKAELPDIKRFPDHAFSICGFWFNKDGSHPYIKNFIVYPATKLQILFYSV